MIANLFVLIFIFVFVCIFIIISDIILILSIDQNKLFPGRVLCPSNISYFFLNDHEHVEAKSKSCSYLVYSNQLDVVT